VVQTAFVPVYGVEPHLIACLPVDMEPLDAKPTNTARSSGQEQGVVEQRVVKSKVRIRRKDGGGGEEDASKRRCVSTACIGRWTFLL
jgi:hypothetical protein